MGTDQELIWNAREWKAKLYSAEHPTNQFFLHQLRQQVYFHSLKCVQKRRYITESGEEKPLLLYENMSEVTRYYKKELKSLSVSQRLDTKIEVVQLDCLVLARGLVERYGSDKVSVLNMANRHNPGNAVLDGRRGQEEYLFRCSDYFRSLYQFVDFGEIYAVPRSEKSYPLHQEFGGIFSKEVTVFRDSENTGYKMLDNPWRVNFIAIAGINKPETILVDGEIRLADRLVPSAKNKLRTLFRIAMDNQQEVLVLGALGCGSYENPARHVAELFKEILQEEEFSGAFREIYFSVKGGPKGGNYQPFKEVFG
ncbi:MAG: TIGR02452 family protein [Bacteroidales bacterium]|nr:TIGR02452 family protein [Bacteroidales bacterium]